MSEYLTKTEVFKKQNKCPSLPKEKPNNNKTLLGEQEDISMRIRSHGNRNGEELFLQSLPRKTQLDLVVGLNEGKAAKDK